MGPVHEIAEASIPRDAAWWQVSYPPMVEIPFPHIAPLMRATRWDRQFCLNAGGAESSLGATRVESRKVCCSCSWRLAGWNEWRSNAL